ncbi:MAG TPA: alpha/beta fold hydrolase [Streptosporangiaceae bacterium]
MTSGHAEFGAAYDALVRRWPAGTRELDLTSEYGSTRVLACGPEDGPPMVLLHGGGTTAASWYGCAAGLSQEYRVYAVDRIGEPGRSTRGERRIAGPADLDRWLDGVLDGLGIGADARAGPAVVCGHSYGGWLALRYALHAPARVRRLVLLDPTQCFAWFRARYLLRALPVLLRPSAARARDFLAWEAGDTDPEYARLYALAAGLPGTRVITARRPRQAELAALASPALVVLAGDSKAHDTGKVAAAARRLPGARVTVLAGVSHHAMPVTRAAGLAALISAGQHG